jgi:serine/threonine-protein kinase
MAARPDTPPALDAIVRWCLAPDPAARPSAADLSSALARFIVDPTGAAYGAAIGQAAPTSVAAGLPASGVHQGGLRPPTAGQDRSGSGPWAWLAGVLGLVVIVASGILLFLLFSGIGNATSSPSPRPTTTPKLVRMPDFVGRTEGWATRTADRLRLVLDVEYVEAESRPGRVVAQLPSPRMEIAVGTAVTIRVATRAETVVVPDVHGLSEADALRQLQAAGLLPGDRSRVDDALPEGYVVSTDPRGGDEVTRDSVVGYIVSSGQVPVPGASRSPGAEGSVGSTALESPGPDQLAADSSASTEASPGFAGSAGSSPAPSVPATAAATSPEAGATPGSDASSPVAPSSPSPSREPSSPVATAGTSVPPGSSAPGSSVPTSTVPDTSSEPSQVAASPSTSSRSDEDATPVALPSQSLALVGDYSCLDLATARSHIEAAGLLVGSIIPSDPEPGEDWLVQQQLPDAGEYLPSGSNVDLVLADPMDPCPGG